MLEVCNITKEYATPRGPLTVLSGVSLSLKRGDAAVITGPSGAGKSTLLYVAGALEPPTGGVVTLDGDNPYQLPEKELAAFRNRMVGFIFQDHCLLPQCTVLENVLVPTLVAPTLRRPRPQRARLRTAKSGAPSHASSGVPSHASNGVPGDASNDDYPKRARELLDQVGLADRADHRPSELSGGEKQRVALARALILRPHLLLCDEPTGNLDEASAEVVANLLLELHRRQQTVLMVVTHSLNLASRFPLRYELRHANLQPAGA